MSIRFSTWCCSATMRRTSFLVLIAATCLSGCASIFYSKTQTGKFSGKLYVEWVAPNQFIYRPDGTDPLVFIDSQGRRIQPQLMYTDAGSIPRLFWSVPEFGPWDFAPGYIIHDWLFVQHHCQITDWSQFSFDSSAQVLAEAIKSQMEKGGAPDPTVVWAVHQAVQSNVARRLWDTGSCKLPPSAPPEGSGAPTIGTVRILTIDFH